MRRAAVWVLHIGACMDASLPGPLRLKEVPVVLNGGSGDGHGRERAKRLEEAFREAGVEPRLRPFRPGGGGREVAGRGRGAGGAAAGPGGGGRGRDAKRGGGRAARNRYGARRDPGRNDESLRQGPGDSPGRGRGSASDWHGRCIRVDVGEVNGRAFINNASLGIYADMVRKRERQQRRLRRSQGSAVLGGALEVLGRSRLLDLRLEVDGRVQECRAPFVFVGNNDYAMEGFVIGTRSRLDGGLLNVYTTRRCGALGLIGLALHALFGRLRQADDFMQWSVPHLRVESPRRRLLVATDGELNSMETPLEFRIRPRSLRVIVP